VIVAVEDTGHQPQSREVDRRDVAAEVAPDGCDAAVLDPDVERTGEAAGPVEDVRTPKGERSVQCATPVGLGFCLACRLSTA
jgi:hypothetical protein